MPGRSEVSVIGQVLEVALARLPCTGMSRSLGGDVWLSQYAELNWNMVFRCSLPCTEPDVEVDPCPNMQQNDILGLHCGHALAQDLGLALCVRRGLSEHCS